MGPRRLVLMVLAAALAGTALVAAPHRASAEPWVRIMFNGDSVTHALEGDYTYRLRIFQEFKRQGVPVNFVGSRNAPYYPPGTTPARYLEPFDTDHSALGGTWLSSQASLIGREVEKHQPDVVVELLGLNDMRFETKAEDVAQSLQTWIDAVRQAKPDTKMVLMQVPPTRGDHREWLHTEIPKFNDLMEGVVQAARAQGAVIEIARTAEGWDPDRFSYDGAHLTPTGDTFFAQRVGEALVSLGVLRRQPLGWRTLPWHRNLAARVQPWVGAAEVRWNQRGLSHVRIWLRRTGEKGRLLPRKYTGFKTTITGLKPGATYEFRLVAVRYRLESSMGPITRTQIRRPPRPAAVGKVSISSRGVRWSRSDRATSYLVKVRREGSRAWRTKRFSSSRSWRITRVTKARVWAVNDGGHSRARQAVRR